MNQVEDVKQCPLCNAANHCALAAGGVIQDCWCKEEAPLYGNTDELPADGCLCRSCLLKLRRNAGGDCALRV